MAEVYTTSEVAQLCGVSVKSVCNWIDRGLLPGYRLPGRDPKSPGHRRVSRPALLKFCLQHQIPLPAEPGGYQRPAA